MDFQQVLRGAALRVTRPRVAVLSAVHAHPHADTDSIVGDNHHHHVVCRSCGLIADVDRAVGEPSCLDPIALHGGFAVDEGEVGYWGLCPSCSTTRSP